MQKIFFDTRKHDAAVRELYGLSEELMMENAASGLEKAVAECLERSEKKGIVILCGGGNNGADGYALARRIIWNVTVLECIPPKSELCTIQAERALKAGVKIVRGDSCLEYLSSAGENGIAVDCIFGSGFHGELPQDISALVDLVNEKDLFRIVCDVPSGLDQYGNCGKSVFMADVTVTMGAQNCACILILQRMPVGRFKLKIWVCHESCLRIHLRSILRLNFRCWKKMTWICRAVKSRMSTRVLSGMR